MPQEIFILRSEPILNPDRAKAGQWARWIHYRVGPNGPLSTVVMDKRDPTPQEVQAAVTADYQAKAALLGQTFLV